MPIVVRRGIPTDANVIAQFNGQLAEESEGIQLDATTIKRGVEAILADQNKGVYYLACDGDDILGQLAVTLEWSDWRNGWYWWLQSVYVRADARGRGIFRTLFEHVVHCAEAAADVAAIRLYVEQHNARALRTYESVGMKPAGYLVYDRLINRQAR